MSFILDALRKSENQHQRQVGPSLADVPVRRRTHDKPWWAVAVAALLAVNLGVLVVVLMRDGSAETSASERQRAQSDQLASAPMDARTSGTQVPLPASESRMPRGNQRDRLVDAAPGSVRSLAEEAAVFDAGEPADADPTLAAASEVPEGPPLVRRLDAPSVAPLAAAPVPDTNPAQSQEVLPTIHEIGAAGTTLPEMHLDIHVYSANPAERFVYVNMRKYSEGQPLKEGPLVERIEPDGIVLNHQGRRFLLPRQ